LIDMIRIFTEPFENANGKMVYNKKLIARRYLMGWFIFDLWAFYPLGLLRRNSEYNEGSSTNET
jgi:hypothetical protein